MDDKTWMFLLFTGSGILLTALAVPLILRKIKPNYMYGFRVQKTLTNPQIWYDANEYAGWRLFWTGIVTLVSSVAFYFIPHVRFLEYNLVMLGIAGAALTVTILQSCLYLRTR